MPIRYYTTYGDDGSLIKNDSSTILRNRSYHNKPFIGYGKRGDFIDFTWFHQDTFLQSRVNVFFAISKKQMVSFGHVTLKYISIYY